MVFLGLSLFTGAQNTCEEALEIEPGIYNVPSITPGGTTVPSCFGGVGNGGMWYTFTAEGTFEATITTFPSSNPNVDNRVHIYTGTCAERVCVAGDDDSGDNLLCLVSWTVLEGFTYYVAFDDRWDNSGFDFKLTFDEAIPVVPPPISFTSVPLPNLNRSLGVVDMNGDYLDDIFDVSPTNVFLLLQNEEGGLDYANYPTENAQFPYSWSITAGDIDGDGMNDLMYGSWDGVSFMLRNEDGESFSTTSSNEYVFSQRGNFIDINNDGHLDAFMCHDVEPNVYYINDGAGNLSYFQGGLSDVPDGGNYGSIWVDYNNDGLPDLFIAKCRGGASDANYNQLFRNDGNGIFTDVSIVSGLYDPIQTWSSAWGDFDNDGWMDVLVGGSASIHKLMRNNGDGTFTDITAGSGFDDLAALGIEWVANDFDNDGYIDVLGANGRLCLNNGDMSFTPYLFPSLVNGPVGDFNNDGFLDIGNASRLHYNNGNENNWVKFNTVGTASNLNGIGARITIYTPAGKQIRDVQSGTGFRYMHSLNVHFGLGQTTQIDSVVVSWPSGTSDTFLNLAINSFHVLTEGEPYDALNVSNVQVAPLLLYPNPAQDNLYIEHGYTTAAATVTIYDLQGRMLLQKPFGAGIEIGMLRSGTYIVVLNSELGSATSKFIKLP